MSWNDTYYTLNTHFVLDLSLHFVYLYTYRAKLRCLPLRGTLNGIKLCAYYHKYTEEARFPIGGIKLLTYILPIGNGDVIRSSMVVWTSFIHKQLTYAPSRNIPTWRSIFLIGTHSQFYFFEILTYVFVYNFQILNIIY